jgi:hypothetical protein
MSAAARPAAGTGDEKNPPGAAAADGAAALWNPGSAVVDVREELPDDLDVL